MRQTMQKSASYSMAVSATLHCLTGCALGEVLGLVLGMILGLGAFATIVLAISLAFLFGFGLSVLPLVQADIALRQALGIVVAADAISITVMELVDNGVMLIIPGAMHAGLVSPLFWISMPVALAMAFLVALPVNYHLLKRGRGHALTMKALGHH